jgi:hypothetical protein
MSITLLIRLTCSCVYLSHRHHYAESISLTVIIMSIKLQIWLRHFPTFNNPYPIHRRTTGVRKNDGDADGWNYDFGIFRKDDGDPDGWNYHVRVIVVIT